MIRSVAARCIRECPASGPVRRDGEHRLVCASSIGSRTNSECVTSRPRLLEDCACDRGRRVHRQPPHRGPAPPATAWSFLTTSTTSTRRNWSEPTWRGPRRSLAAALPSHPLHRPCAAARAGGRPQPSLGGMPRYYPCESQIDCVLEVFGGAGGIPRHSLRTITSAPAALATSAVESVQLSATTTTRTSDCGYVCCRSVSSTRVMRPASLCAGTTTDNRSVGGAAGAQQRGHACRQHQGRNRRFQRQRSLHIRDCSAPSAGQSNLVAAARHRNRHMACAYISRPPTRCRRPDSLWD